jgi:uncharacterized membrane protein
MNSSLPIGVPPTSSTTGFSVPMTSQEMVNPIIIYNEMLQSFNKIIGSLSVIAEKYAKSSELPYSNNMSKKQMAKSNKNNTAKNTSATNTSATNTPATNEMTQPTNEPTNQPTNEYTNTNSYYQGGSRRNKKFRSLRKKKGKATRRRGT